MSTLLLALVLGAGTPTDDEAGKAAVAVQLAKLRLHSPPPVAPAVPTPPTADGGTGALPNRSAPAGQEWKRYPGEPWKLFPLTTAAPAVAAPRPFSPAAPTTATTAVPPAGTSPRPAPGRGSSAGTTRTGPGTSMNVPFVIPAGGTNCPPAG